MIVNSESPDLLLCYTPGNAGRLLTHLVMLSDDVHTWDDRVEAELSRLPIKQHADYKCKYIITEIFLSSLSSDITKWKDSEPDPFGLSYEKTKKFVRHAWMMPGVADIARFGKCKVAYTDYRNNVYFSVRAMVAKHTYGITRPQLTLPRGAWLSKDPLEQQHQLVAEFFELEKILAEWEQTPYYAIDLAAIVADDQGPFVSQYLRLCEFYQISPQLECAIAVWEHWKQLQWRRN